LLLAGNIAAILPVRTDILRCRKIGFPLMSLTTVTSSRLTPGEAPFRRPWPAYPSDGGRQRRPFCLSARLDHSCG